MQHRKLKKHLRIKSFIFLHVIFEKFAIDDDLISVKVFKKKLFTYSLDLLT